jgi:NAD(P)-dependent dehydrogenase (short-subunit alcohol dehydrogenase family)
MRIAGSVVLITGANRGIGRAFVAGFARAGAAKIYAAGRSLGLSDDPRVEPVTLDVTDPSQVADAARKCRDVSVLVNNAGVAMFVPLLGAPSMDAARLEMETNYFGALSMTRAFAPVLAKNGGGAIINMLSIASWRTAGQLGSYSASKMAALALTRGTRIELRAQGTLVVAVHPGFVETQMVEHVQVPKISAEQVVAATLAALEAGQEEVVTDEAGARTKALMRDNPVAIEAEAQKGWDEHLIPPKPSVR